MIRAGSNISATVQKRFGWPFDVGPDASTTLNHDMNESENAAIAVRRRRTGWLAALLTTMMAVATAPVVVATTIAGIEIPDTLDAGEHTLLLNGAGMREKLFIDAYIACLYVPEPDTDPVRILTADEPQAVIMHITSGMVTRERLTASLPKDLRRSTGNDLDSIRPQVDLLLTMFDGEIAPGDTFRLIYLPGEGTQVWHNDRLKGAIEGLDFKRALFGIWLSEKPTQESLKSDLLRADRGV